MTQFIVTTSAAGQKRSQVWNPTLPLTLGHPLRWIAERTEQGVRIRSLGGKTGEIKGSGVTLIPFAQLLADSPEIEVALPESKGISIRIRSVSEMHPAFGRSRGDRVQVFSCNGPWVMASALFSGRYQAKAGTVSAFSMSEKEGAYHFESGVAGLKLRVGKEPVRELKVGESVQVPSAKLVESEFLLGHQSWRFGCSAAVELPVHSTDRNDDAETLWFNKALRYTMVAFGAFVVMTWLWPKPKNDPQELVPAQFAKIVLAKPPAEPKVKATSSEGNPTQSQASAPEKVQKAAVVQAFRAKALSSAVSGLLKGGMTSLLAQSDFVAGKSASADARRNFDTRSTSLQPSGPTSAVSADTNQAVAALGGSGTGKGAGYGKGEHAGVKGQGQAFVSMDIAGASVDEGLTKDEVGEVIHRHLSEVRYCYESAMIRTPDIEGKLMVNFTIGGNGMVKSTEVKSSTLPDPRLDDCILRRLTTWKFPNPRGGVDVAVGYPFIFKTLGR